jgi:hypothetical protein
MKYFLIVFCIGIFFLANPTQHPGITIKWIAISIGLFLTIIAIKYDNDTPY